MSRAGSGYNSLFSVLPPAISGGAVAGIVVGVLVIVAAVIVISFLMYRYYRGLSILPFQWERMSSSGLAFNNATYNSGQSETVNFSES